MSQINLPAYKFSLRMFQLIELLFGNTGQKQVSSCVPIKRCSGKMQQIYRRIPMQMCNSKATLLKLHFGIAAPL